MWRERFATTVLFLLLWAAPLRAQVSTVDTQVHIITAVQDALAWIGLYDLLADGAIGEKSTAAITEFQRRQGWPPTGDLDPEQKLRLLQIADSARRQVGFQVVNDLRAAMTMALPTRLLAARTDTTHGSRYASPDGQIEVYLARFRPDERTLSSLFGTVIGSSSMTGITYKALRRDAFFVAGFNEKSDFYHSARVIGGEVRGFTIAYPRERAPEFGPIIVAMGNAFKAPMVDYSVAAALIRSAPAVAGFEQRADDGAYGAQLYRVAEPIADGVLNIRLGPGASSQVLSSIPAGSRGVRMIGPCESPSAGRPPWCKVEWSNIVGWVSMSGLDADQTNDAAPRPASPSLGPRAVTTTEIDRRKTELQPPAPRLTASSGTGFIVSKSGHVLTNAHVVSGCLRIEIRSGANTARPARIVAADVRNDLAVMETGIVPGAVAQLRASAKLGEDIAVFGYPLAGLLTSSGNFTVGNVTASAGVLDDTRMLQISAAIQPGNSGGPVLDQAGNVIGVVVSKLDALRYAAIARDIPQNINFGIKSAVAINFLEANGIPFETRALDTPLSRPDLAESAKRFTVSIECQNS